MKLYPLTKHWKRYVKQKCATNRFRWIGYIFFLNLQNHLAFKVRSATKESRPLKTTAGKINNNRLVYRTI